VVKIDLIARLEIFPAISLWKESLPGAIRAIFPVRHRKNRKAVGPFNDGSAALFVIFSMLCGKKASPCLS
jgi:hypothetical protein